jgi:sec-independent protein translocase protein TatA
MLFAVTLSHLTAVAMIGTQELIWIFAILFLLFGASKLPALARSLGKSMREFKKAQKEITDEIESAADDDYPSNKARGDGTLND